MRELFEAIDQFTLTGDLLIYATLGFLLWILGRRRT